MCVCVCVCMCTYAYERKKKNRLLLYTLKTHNSLLLLENMPEQCYPYSAIKSTFERSSTSCYTIALRKLFFQPQHTI